MTQINLPEFVRQSTTMLRAGASDACDVYFFAVQLRPDVNIDAARVTLLDLIKTHQGAFTECQPLDGHEHDYIELGAWLGDQGYALRFIGLCERLHLGTVLTPNKLPIPDDLKQIMAGAGCVTLTAAFRPSGTDLSGSMGASR